MGGDDSQKLLPWRGMLLLSGAQLLPFQRENQHSISKRGASPGSQWRLLLKQLEDTDAGLAGISIGTAGYITRRHRGIAAWSTSIPPNW